MKKLFGVVFVFQSLIGFSNMASPLQRGSAGMLSFLHSNVTILDENIYIKPSADFATAFFSIRYTIEAAQTGNKIPMLFHALRYDSGFVLKVDGIAVTLSKLPSNFLQSETPTGFEKYFEPDHSGNSLVKISWSGHGMEIIDVNDLLFFEMDLSKGKHSIEVQYIAKTWVDRSKWVKSYAIPYALTPARYWKNFGKLYITIDGSAFGKTYSTNFGKPLSGTVNSISRWEFDSIPQDIISIKYEPVLSAKAAKWLQFGNDNLTLIFGALLTLLHGIWIYRNRKTNKSTKASGVFWWGIFLVPLAFLIFYIYSFSIIDQQIGVEASNRHGYTFMSIIFYPVLVIGYGIIMYLIDYFCKKK